MTYIYTAVERPSNFDGHRGQGISPLLKISPALMQVENLSLQSLARSTRGVGVTDLREAIQGRGSMSNSALVTQPSISTLDHTSSVGNGSETTNGLSPSRSRKKLAANGEVRDVLNKLGIGKQPRSSLLKSSFPPVKKTDSRLVLALSLTPLHSVSTLYLFSKVKRFHSSLQRIIYCHCKDADWAEVSCIIYFSLHCPYEIKFRKTI
jgi:hypothetical protein